MRGSWRVVGVLLGGLLSCSTTPSENLPNAPQIEVFPAAQAFGTDTGFGTFIGTQPQQSFSVKNGGKQTLILSSVTRSGDSAFTFIGPSFADPAADGGIVESKEQTFMTVFFKPTQPIMYSAKLIIKSNAATAVLIATDGGSITPPDPTSIEIPLSGLGVLPTVADAGPDGG